MPRLPDVSSLGERQAPNFRAPLVQDQSALIALDATSRAVNEIGGAVEHYADTRDQFRMAKAGADFSKVESEARKFNDNDWETYEDRYRKTLTDSKDSILKNVRLPRNREALSLQLDEAINRGASQVRTTARAKEIEFGKADLASTLDNYRNAALSVGDEASRAQNIKGAQLAITSALANQYIDPTDAERLNKGWSKSYAEGSLSMMSPEQRIETLSKQKGTVADMLPPDRRAELLKSAQNESRDLRVRRESQAHEDTIASKFNGDWSGALRAAREIKDPEVRDSTVTRIKIREGEAKQADLEQQDGLQDQALSFLNDGGHFADLPLKIKNGLKPSALNSLRSYAEQMADGGVKHTDPETLITLSQMSTDDPQKFGELNMLQYRDKMTDSDFEQYVDLQRKVRTGSLDGKATGFMTLNQVRDERLKQLFGAVEPAKKESDKVADARRKFVSQYEMRLKDFRTQNGRTASADDARKLLDDMTADVAINRDFWFDSKKRAYEISQEDLPVPDEDRYQIIASLKRANKPVTEQAVLDLYRKVNAK